MSGNAYADLLRDARGLRREHLQAREAWFTAPAADRKEDTLVDIEILVKGLACFADPRNHPGGGRIRTTINHDFHQHLQHAKDGMGRIVQLIRALLGERDRTYVFQRYLETV